MSNQYNNELVAEMARLGKPFCSEDNSRLYPLVAAGDSAARQQMIEGNMSLAVAKVESFIRCFPNVAHLRDDLTSAAFIGLTKAVNKMAEGTAVKYEGNWNPTDFIGTWINCELGEAVEAENPVRLPRRSRCRACANGQKLKAPSSKTTSPIASRFLLTRRNWRYAIWLTPVAFVTRNGLLSPCARPDIRLSRLLRQLVSRACSPSTEWASTLTPRFIASWSLCVPMIRLYSWTWMTCATHWHPFVLHSVGCDIGPTRLCALPARARVQYRRRRERHAERLARYAGHVLGVHAAFDLGQGARVRLLSLAVGGMCQAGVGR